jgi:hypothetical protein
VNPFSALAELAVGFWKAGKAQAWAKLIFQLLASGLISFLFVCGTALVGSRSWAVAIGMGMIMASVSMTVVFRRSPLTKGMLLVLPSEEAAKEINSDLQTIQK